MLQDTFFSLWTVTASGLYGSTFTRQRVRVEPKIPYALASLDVIDDFNCSSRRVAEHPEVHVKLNKFVFVFHLQLCLFTVSINLNLAGVSLFFSPSEKLHLCVLE